MGVARTGLQLRCSRCHDGACLCPLPDALGCRKSRCPDRLAVSCHLAPGSPVQLPVWPGLVWWRHLVALHQRAALWRRACAAGCGRHGWPHCISCLSDWLGGAHHGNAGTTRTGPAVGVSGGLGGCGMVAQLDPERFSLAFAGLQPGGCPLWSFGSRGWRAAGLLAVGLLFCRACVVGRGAGLAALVGPGWCRAVYRAGSAVQASGMDQTDRPDAGCGPGAGRYSAGYEMEPRGGAVHPAALLCHDQPIAGYSACGLARGGLAIAGR